MTPSQDSQLVLRVSKLLHQHDPMNTSCNVNAGMEDEYLNEARDIVRHLSAGVPLRDALVRTFDERYWEGCLLEAQRKSSVDDRLASLAPIVQEGA